MTDCPDCGRTLRHEEQFAIALDACTCGGLWFDAGELSDWLAHREATIRNPEKHILSPGSEPPRACPVSACRAGAARTLESFRAGEARLGRCCQCRGFWVPRLAMLSLLGDDARGYSETVRGSDDNWTLDLSYAVVEGLLRVLAELFS